MTTRSKGLPITGITSRFYDIGSDLIGFGKTFAERIVQEAALKPDESVLDCGCGTGTLALAARRKVGPKGRVCGIDISKDQLEQARAKARNDNLRIEFLEGSVDEIPFPNNSFDAVLSALMIHHLPTEIKKGMFREIRRVLRKGGRIVIADFGPPAHYWGWLVAAPVMLMCLTHSTARDNLFNRLADLMSQEGLKVTDEKTIKEVVHIIKAE
jgi:ubiquinone/menaquinone biosynthesis C-methylase UbiE